MSEASQKYLGSLLGEFCSNCGFVSIKTEDGQTVSVNQNFPSKRKDEELGEHALASLLPRLFTGKNMNSLMLS